MAALSRASYAPEPDASGVNLDYPSAIGRVIDGLMAYGPERIISVRELTLECAGYGEEFLAFVDSGGVLDRYYLATRYPDAVAAPAVPFQTFARREAEQALSYATEMVELVRGKVPAASPGPGA